MITPEVIKFQREFAGPFFECVYAQERSNHIMRAYIAGKVTGLPMDEVQQKFAAAERLLQQQGYEVVNPVASTSHLDANTTPWETYMRITVALMLTCDVVVCLRDCDHSRGAAVEIDLAIKLGIPCWSFSDLMNRRLAS